MARRAVFVAALLFIAVFVRPDFEANGSWWHAEVDARSGTYLCAVGLDSLVGVFGGCDVYTGE